MEKSTITNNNNPKNSKGTDYKQLYELEKSLRIQLEKQLEIERIKLKKLATGKYKGKLCPQCFSQQDERKKKDLFIDPQGFSKRVELTINRHKEEELQSNNMYNNGETSCPMVQNFAIFGIPQSNIPIGQPNSMEQFQGQILYSLKQPTDIEAQATKFVFPSGMAIKKIGGQKAKEKAIEMMSFCYTNLKSFLLTFQGNMRESKIRPYANDQLLNLLNPERRLFCICIGIHDYTWLQQKIESKLNISLSLADNILSANSVNSQEQVNSTGTPTNQDNGSMKSAQQKPLSIAISQRVFCIMSYYPFFTFFEQIIRNLINIVKMERLTIYKHKDEDIKNTDSEFQLNRMKNLYAYCYKNLIQKKMQINRHYQLKLFNGQKISLMTDNSLVKSYFIDEWIFSILSMFTADIFIDLFTLILLQDRLVFVCQNSHILTYTIYLFSNILLRPFKFAFPVVNIIPNEQEFLNAPFPIVYGMLKKKKYLQQNRIVQKYNNTYVFLSPGGVQIIYTQSKKNFIKARPVKLKNQLNPLFKQLKKQRMHDQKSSKYDIQYSQYCILSTEKERQNSLKIVELVNNYVQKQLVNNLPTRAEIDKMKENIDLQQIPADKQSHSYLLNKISKELRKNHKDPFFDKFLDTQMINGYFFQ